MLDLLRRRRVMSLAEARKIAGSLGFPSKMPGTSYGLPASACIAGARLMGVPGSICSTCYAVKDFYGIPNAVAAQHRRLAAIHHPDWVKAMVRLLVAAHAKPIRVDLGAIGVRAQRVGGERFRRKPPGYHRWHDSGDLQSVTHLEKIVEVCRRTPRIRHWLPTRELAILRAWDGHIPDNLTVRVSATMVDGPAPAGWPLVSLVHTKAPIAGARECPAPRQGHECGSCRACWSRDVPAVSYKRH